MTVPDIHTFFSSEGIKEFAEVSITEIPPPDRNYVNEFLPGAGSVIIFAKEIPLSVYNLPPKEKTREMLIIAESLDMTAKKLSALISAGGISAKPVPLYLPVTITEGKVRGLVRLKQIAAAGGLGTIGKSSLLLTPQYGPRVFLSGIVTGNRIPKLQAAKISVTTGNMADSAPGMTPGEEDREESCRRKADILPLCTGCGLCIGNCPGEAFGPDGVDAFRCMTIRTFVPPLFVPSVKWILKRRILLRTAAPLAPYIARLVTMPCSGCVTKCPKSGIKCE
ncbi:hypothetical protein [Methanoplanus endosymbiosus]|uniref:4Fe-4S ferredoxin-type domain-containing protein n=1 Tax=Methanoplanus endosymbiosus TaxID=33865 RepID=A0A9E7THW9_9EURY|nr:hypothetical protein [Methanoplanus endosymbiosus]UUX91393.1 hypothetical protein L6E24_08365 [Methanoplanus endosymbiosus]